MHPIHVDRCGSTPLRVRRVNAEGMIPRKGRHGGEAHGPSRITADRADRSWLRVPADRRAAGPKTAALAGCRAPRCPRCYDRSRGPVRGDTDPGIPTPLRVRRVDARMFRGRVDRASGGTRIARERAPIGAGSDSGHAGLKSRGRAGYARPRRTPPRTTVLPGSRGYPSERSASVPAGARRRSLIRAIRVIRGYRVFKNSIAPSSARE